MLAVSDLRRSVARIDALIGGAARRRVIGTLAAVLALDSADKAAVGASAKQLQAAMHLDALDIGILLSVSSVVGAIATLPAGWAVDRANRSRLLTFAVVTWGVAMLCAGLATSFTFLLLSRIALGGVTAVAGPAVASLVGDFFPEHERGRIFSYIITGELLGTGVGFIVSGELAALTWRAAFFVLVPPAIGVAWLLRRLQEPVRGGASRLRRAGDPEPDPRDPGHHDIRYEIRGKQLPAPDQRLVRADAASADSLRWAFRYIVRTRTNVVLIVASALSYFLFAGVRGFGVLYASDQYDLPQSVTTLLLPALGIGAVAGVLVGGRLADRWLSRGDLVARIEVAAALPVLMVVFFVPALLVHSALLALPLLIAAAGCLGGTNPPLDAARLDVMPPQLWGRAEAVRTVLRSGFEALAPITFGVLASHVFAGHSGLTYTFLIMLLPLLGAAALLGTVGRRSYPRDVSTASAARRRLRKRPG